MRPLNYLLLMYVKNTVKELKKKPLVLIMYIFAAVALIGMILLSIAAPAISESRGSREVYGAVVSTALFVFSYFGIKQGISRGNSFFRLADVNMVFTAPISPKKVLVYGFIKQFFTSLIIIFVLIFQIPNLRMNFPMVRYSIPVIYLSVFILFFSMQLIGILIYSIASKSARVRTGMERALNVMVFAVLAGFLLTLVRVKDFVHAAVVFLNNSYISYIPFIGWFKVVLDSTVKGFGTAFFINAALIIVSIAAMIFVIYRLKTDYYEDVLEATERLEEIVKQKREGRIKPALSNARVKRVGHTYWGSGPSAIFHRHLLEYKKTGFFFIDRNTLIIGAIGIASKYFFPQASIRTVLYFSIYMLFFFALQGKWTQELGKHYIYLIPAGSAAKVFYATLADVIKYMVDGFVLFIAAGVIFKADAATIVLSAIAYTSYGAVYTYGDVLFQKLLGSMHSKNLSLLVKSVITLFVIAPGLVIYFVVGFALRDIAFAQYFTYAILIAYNVIASFLIMLIGKSIFENLEMG